jgi:hypothetical protein
MEKLKAYLKEVEFEHKFESEKLKIDIAAWPMHAWDKNLLEEFVYHESIKQMMEFYLQHRTWTIEDYKETMQHCYENIHKVTVKRKTPLLSNKESMTIRVNHGLIKIIKNAIKKETEQVQVLENHSI